MNKEQLLKEQKYLQLQIKKLSFRDRLFATKLDFLEQQLHLVKEELKRYE